MGYIDIEIDKQLSFGEFLLMPTNSLAQSAARGIAEGKVENSPLCLYSEAGCGKTHLLNAIGNRYLELNPGKKVVLTSVVKMIENYITALQDGKMAEFRQRYRSASMLLVDDLEALEKPKQFQEELFNSVNAMLSEKKLIVFASAKCPTQLDLAERLIARIAGGLVVEIEKLSPGGQYEFLKYQLQKAGVAVAEANLPLIVNSVHGNAAELIRVVKAIRLAAEPNEGEATKVTVRKALASCGIEI